MTSHLIPIRWLDCNPSSLAHKSELEVKMSPMPKLESFEDVVSVLQPIAPNLSERNIKDLLLVVHQNPLAGPELLESYQAASPEVPTSVWSSIWSVLQAAAQVADVITSIGGVVTMVV